jgi:hypothetical protein
LVRVARKKIEEGEFAKWKRTIIKQVSEKQ